MDLDLQEIYQDALNGKGNYDVAQREKLDKYLTRIQTRLQGNGFKCDIQYSDAHAEMRVRGDDGRGCDFIADVESHGKVGSDIRIVKVGARFWNRDGRVSFSTFSDDFTQTDPWWLKNASTFIVRAVAAVPAPFFQKPQLQ